MKLTGSAKTALALTLAAMLYFGVRGMLGERAEPPAQGEVARPFAVVVQTVKPQSWREEVRLRGRTQAFRKIRIEAETSGVVAATPVEPGTPVEAGEVLCVLRLDARAAALREAKAAFNKARLDHEAAVKLSKEGFRSETALASTKAALDLARANLEQAEVAVDKTEMKAPWAGTFDARLTEIGAFLNVGDPCGVLIQRSPFLVVGSVSEREVAKIEQGDLGVAELATGERVEGVVRFVSKASDAATRTFEVQLEDPNADGALRDGVTADMTIAAERRTAHLVPRAALTFDDRGRLGVRTVGADDTVAFNEVQLLGESDEGAFVAGLDGAPRLITRGQEFVSNGQKVAVTEQKG
ncbi:MAG: efflux RND transporter periplasmic adaptor subunit [Parvularculaceae bacterium]|nr:efflux RND transporter periplasmic adaptor subunit [Parvularculaceae bacterium]